MTNILPQDVKDRFKPYVTHETGEEKSATFVENPKPDELAMRGKVIRAKDDSLWMVEVHSNYTVQYCRIYDNTIITQKIY